MPSLESVPLRHPHRLFQAVTPHTATKRPRVAKHLTAKHAIYAKQIHEHGYLYYFYGLFDGSIQSYKALKYLFEVFSSDPDSNHALHQWVKTPTGLAVALFEFVILTALSTISTTGKAKKNKDNDNPKNKYVNNILLALWPYIRNIIVELKKTNTSIQNVVGITNIIRTNDLAHFITPLGLFFGCLSAINRCWFEQRKNQRKQYNQEIAHCEEELQKLRSNLSSNLNETLNPVDLSRLQEKLPNAEALTKTYYYFLAAFSGAIDSLCYHMSVLLLLAASFPAYTIPAAIFCASLSLLVIAGQVYEEYQQQRELKLARVQIDLAILDLQSQYQKDDSLPSMLSTDIQEQTQHLQELMPSTLEKMFRTVKYGLEIYKATTILSLTFASFLGSIPAALYVTHMAVGASLLVGFTAYTCINYALQNNSTQSSQPNSLTDSNNGIKLKQLQEVASKIVSPSQVLLDYFMEIINTFSRGLSRGKKIIHYHLVVAALEIYTESNLENKPIALGLSIVFAILNACIQALFTYTRSFEPLAKKETNQTPQQPAETAPTPPHKQSKFTLYLIGAGS